MASKTMTEQLFFPVIEAINQVPIFLLFPLCVAALGFLGLIVSSSLVACFSTSTTVLMPCFF